MFENKVVLLNSSKLSGGELSSIYKTGIKVYDFYEAYKIDQSVDFVLLAGGGQEGQHILSNIHFIPKHVKIGWWMWDYRKADWFSDPRFINLVDYMFLPYYNYFDDYNRFSKNGVYYMPQPGHVWETKFGRNLNTNCVFIGNVNTYSQDVNRGDILKYIAELTSVTLLQGEHVTMDQSYIYKTTPISLNISNNEWDDRCGSSMIGGTSNRLYNIIAAGGFAFTQYFDKLDELFINHKHLVWFKDINEIPDLLNVYLSDLNKINDVKLNAKNIFEKNHTATHRLDNIFKIMNGTCNEFLGKL
jgi:hypothetical protein